MRRLDRVQWEQGLRWVRTRPWSVWATAGAVFVLFAVLGAVTRGPATAPVAAHSLGVGPRQSYALVITGDFQLLPARMRAVRH